MERVEIRPRVGGAIQQILFEEGSIVKAGAPLYVIDPRPYEAVVASAEAALASAESQLKLAKIELDRAAGLVKENAVSKSAHDTRRNDYRVALASIKSAKATLKTANLNLEYAHINAPVLRKYSPIAVELPVTPHKYRHRIPSHLKVVVYPDLSGLHGEYCLVPKAA